jgi:hypothetical protein
MLDELEMSAVCASTIIDDYSSLVITARPALGIYGLVAFKGWLLDGPEPCRWRFGRVEP